MIIRMKNVNEEFLSKLQHLMNEYGYQLSTDSSKETSLSFDDLEFIPKNYQVFRSGKEIVLTGKEFEILMLLAQNRDLVNLVIAVYNKRKRGEA